ncbi:MAG: hypothetical protein ACRYFS_03680 [Janthinobacterium lividum]
MALPTGTIGPDGAGDDAGDGTLPGAAFASFPAGSGITAGLGSTGTIGPDGAGDDAGDGSFPVGGGPFSVPVIPFPPWLYPVARWRSQLRRLIGDEPLLVPAGQSADPSVLTVLPDSVFDEALREALAALSEWRPQTRVIPLLTLIAGQGAYVLPADFGEPIADTWGSLLAPDPMASGQFPGSRDFFRRRQMQRDSAQPSGQAGQYGSTFGVYTGLWSGGFYDGFGGGFPILPEDANGNVIPGGAFTHSRVDFYPAAYDSPAPVLVLTPPPFGTQTLVNAQYRAIALPQRLTADSTGAAWTVDNNGNLVFSPAYLSQDFVDATDVLPFSPNDAAIRLSLRYAMAWTLMQKVIPLSETDSEKFAFYEIKTGLGRKDLLAIAGKAMNEFDAGTKKVAHGGRY